MVMLSLQVSEELYKEFELARERGGFHSRSEAMREAITEFITRNTTSNSLEGQVICTINVTFPIKEEVLNLLTDISNEHENLIQSTTDLRMNEVSLRTFILSGNGKEINDFYQALASNRFFRVMLTKVIFDNPASDESGNEEGKTE